MISPPSFFTVQFSLLLALTLSIIPLSDGLIVYNPQWLVLVVAYWAIFSPQRIGILSAWVWGLLLDVALGTHLGIHALSLAVICYLSIILHQRLRMYPLWQQAFFIWLLASSDKLLVFQLKNFFFSQAAQWDYWLSPLISAIFWPAMLVIMLFYHRLRHN